MIAGITNDFTSTVTLDAETSSSSKQRNISESGAHPCVTVDNLLAFLPIIDIEFENWSDSATYGKYSDTKSLSDIVKHSDKLYQSISSSNTANDPSSSTSDWMETNIESLRLKKFIDSVFSKVYSELNLTKRLVSNQYLYEKGSIEKTLPENFAGWMFEPKGSDYTAITINQISLQKSGTTPVDVYILNQGVLIYTRQVTPKNGVISFNDLGYTMFGPGVWIIAIDSTDVLVGNSNVAPMSFDGFVCHTVVGSGSSDIEAANWTKGTAGNGIGLNVSVSLDSSVFINNNIQNFGTFIRATFELMALQMFMANSNIRVNKNERGIDDKLLLAETKNAEVDTVLSRYLQALKAAKSTISKTFDAELSKDDSLIEVDIDTP